MILRFFFIADSPFKYWCCKRYPNGEEGKKRRWQVGKGEDDKEGKYMKKKEKRKKEEIKIMKK